MCGVWIASWADDDEQYKEEQSREGLLLAGAMNCWEELSHPSLSLSLPDLLYLPNSLANSFSPASSLQPSASFGSVGGWSYL